MFSGVNGVGREGISLARLGQHAENGGVAQALEKHRVIAQPVLAPLAPVSAAILHGCESEGEGGRGITSRNEKTGGVEGRVGGRVDKRWSRFFSGTRLLNSQGERQGRKRGEN